MITIIDYGLGNIQAFLNVYNQLHISAKVARSMSDLDDATKLILPGVGHFDYAMQRFNDSGMRPKVESLVLEENIPILGVCAGMQIMAEASEEGVQPGLGWIDGTVKRLNQTVKPNSDLALPHMGWNNVTPNHKELFNGIDSDALEFYFLHSYYFECSSHKNCIGTTNYGSKFCSVVNKKNIFGVQFHPEKSHYYGISLLNNFAELTLC